MSIAIFIAMIGTYFQTFTSNIVKGLRVTLFFRAVLFSLHLSGVAVYLYKLHFYQNEQCEYKHIWILMSLLWIVPAFSLVVRTMLFVAVSVLSVVLYLYDKAVYDTFRDLNPDKYSIVVLGAHGTGKSALTIRLVTNNFLDEGYVDFFDASLEDSYFKSVDIDGRGCHLNILDTCGHEEFSSFESQWFREGQAFLVVYSITSRTTFDEAIRMRERILRTKEE
eukprot:33075_1